MCLRGKLSWTLWILVIIAFCMVPTCGNLQLSHLSTVYLPSEDSKTPEYGGSGVEQLAYDPVGKLIYVAGKSVYHVLGVDSEGNLSKKLTRYVDHLTFTDIDVCNGRVFMTSHNRKEDSKGALRIYKTFDESQPNELPFVEEIIVGTEPDMLEIRKDCRTALVAVEGEPYEEGDDFVDPLGEVAIINISENDEKSTIQSLNFSAFDDRQGDLESAGVRFIYRKNNNKLSNDLEPAYITVDEKENLAYVTLQENNAMGVIDLTTNTVTDLLGLGYKQWGYLDASDKDSGIRITFWPIRAWYGPDGTKFHEWKGNKFIVTANEGKVKEYNSFTEATRGITKKDLSDDIHPILKDAVESDKRLGRLQFSKFEGKDQSGKYEALYTYGGRSFSIWDVPSASSGSTMTQIYDSGSDIETLTALYCPHLFNSDGDSVDQNSDNKGPAPESVTMAELGDRLYIFIGIETPGTIIVYSIGSDISKPKFETLFCDGIPDDSRSMKELFKDGDVYGVDPEDIRFYPASDSPTGRPILMVAGTVSSSITLLDVKVTED